MPRKANKIILIYISLVLFMTSCIKLKNEYYDSINLNDSLFIECYHDIYINSWYLTDSLNFKKLIGNYDFEKNEHLNYKIYRDTFEVSYFALSVFEDSIYLESTNKYSIKKLKKDKIKESEVR
jgi:hypothetical protein